MSRTEIPEVVLKVIRESYTACGECMFLFPSLFEVFKNNNKTAYCNLFNMDLERPDYSIEPCQQCNDLGE